MLDKDTPPDSSITKQPTLRKRRATGAPGQREDHMPRLRRLARKPTPDSGQQVSCISGNSPSSKAPRALAGLRWQCSNKPSPEPVIAEPPVPMPVASGGLDSTSAVPVPTCAPKVVSENPFNGAEVFPSCTPDDSDQYPWESLEFLSPGLDLVSGGAHLTQWSNLSEAPVPSAPKEEGTEYARQQSCESRSVECPWGSLLEQIVSVELVISQLSRNAKKSPLQQVSPQGFEVLLEDFMELKQRYLHLRKSVQDSKKSCKRAQCLG